MAPCHVRSKVCIAPIQVQRKFADFAPHMDRSNADLAPHMEGIHADFAPCIERRYSFRDQQIAQSNFFLQISKRICLDQLYLRSYYKLYKLI